MYIERGKLMKRRKQIGLIIIITVLLGGLVYFQTIQNIGSVEIKRWSILSESFTLEKFNITKPNYKDVQLIKESIEKAKEYPIKESVFQQSVSIPGVGEITFIIDNNQTVSYTVYQVGVLRCSKEKGKEKDISYFKMENAEEIYDVLMKYMEYIGD